MHGGTQLLAPGRTGAKVGFTGEFLVMLDGEAVGDKDSLLVL